MFAILLKHRFLTALIIVFVLLSIICQIAAGVIFHRMIAETDNMSATKNKLLKQCKQKYANYYKLNGKMVNTAVFVDRFLQRIRIAGIPLLRLSHVSGQFMMLSVLSTGISICLSLAAGDTLFQIIPYYLVSILELYLYFSVSGMIDMQERRRTLKINLVDYLENHLTPRLEIEKESLREEGVKNRELRTQEFLQEEKDKHSPSDAVSIGYQEELESLLEEFFA